MNTRRALVLVVLAGAVSAAPGLAAGEAVPPAVVVSTREALIQAIRGARPGAMIRVAPGEYRGGLQFADLRGEAGRPIIITADDPEQPPRIVGGASCVHLTRAQHVELHDLELSGATGNGLNIDDGGDSRRPSRGLVLKGLHVSDVGPRGNRDGIKLSGVDAFTVESCRLERWGDQGSAIDMVGCHHGTVTRCEFRHRADILGNGVQTKGGSSDIAVTHCRFVNAGSRALNLGGSTGRAYFRPPGANYEAKDIRVSDCTIIGSMAAVACVGIDGARVAHNTIYRPQRWVFRVLQESAGGEFVPCRNGRFTDNLIVFRAQDVRSVVNVGAGTAIETFAFARNHWYCSDRPDHSRRLRLPVAESDGRYGPQPRFVDEQAVDLRLRSDSPASNAGARTPAVE